MSDFQNVNLLDNLKKSDVEVFGEIKQVINIVDAALAPPTEVTGDRYIIEGTPHVDWDSEAADNYIMEFDGVNWKGFAPITSYPVYLTDTNTFSIYNGSSWVDRVTKIFSKVITSSDASIGLTASTYRDSWLRLTLNGNQILSILGTDGWQKDDEFTVSAIGTGLKTLSTGVGVTFNIIDNNNTVIPQSSSYNIEKHVRVKALSSTEFDIMSVPLNDPNTVLSNVVTNFTKQQYFGRVSVVTGDPAFVWDLANAQSAVITLTANSSISTTGMVDGATYILEVVQGGAGNFTLSFSAEFVDADDSTIAYTKTLSTAVGSSTHIAFICNGTEMAGS